ncbi:glycosyltransferase family 2 protein [Actibacterium sp. 188UL27-1]|uniref:glycosyltransferase family 2 protein n=1 Tax=Actibacterium sp. 188UL27-1 TaxID=2786961 RepID=UPI0019574FD6|nr:glycosyltransferase family 2 protein [Actibacterium sp. 188UL27-1]MBM7069108.1 glycosyltransferase family 2 protein [Actibacterium sp. 188UL27-1]
MSPPDIAVIVPAWNAEATLERAVSSALAQHDVSVQVIVVDDASTDGTLDVARRLAEQDNRITALDQPLNRGPAAARNRGLAATQARFVTPLDSDDFMEPDRLSKLVMIAESGAWDFVADDLYKVAEDVPDGPRHRLWSQDVIGIQELTFQLFVRGNLSRLHGGRGELGFIKPLVSNRFLQEHALRYDENMRLGEDYAFYATALLKGARFCLTDPAGYVAVTRATSLSGQHSAKDLGALVSADDKLAQLPNLTAADLGALQEHKIETRKRWHWMRLIDAVKQRDISRAIGCFAGPPAVGLSLVGKLIEQLYLRSTRRVFGRQGSVSE